MTTVSWGSTVTGLAIMPSTEHAAVPTRVEATARARTQGADMNEASFVSPAEVEGRVFRIQSKQYFFTYKTHIDKLRYRLWLQGVCDAKKGKSRVLLEKCYIAHENGEGDSVTPYEHTHVLVKFSAKFETENARAFDFEGIHPNIGSVRNWGGSCVYMSKEDKVCAEEISTHEKTKTVTGADILDNFKTAGEAMRVRPLHEANAIKTLFEIAHVNVPAPRELSLLPWQEQLSALIPQHDNRAIMWVCDQIGSSGKSMLMDYLGTQDKSWLVVRDFGKGGDFPSIISNAVRDGWTGYGILVDLPRSAESNPSMYRHLEMAKAMIITCTKYNSHTFLKPGPDPARVVIMANWYPSIFDAEGAPTMTMDRWNIYRMAHLRDGVATKLEDTLPRGAGYTERQRAELGLLRVDTRSVHRLKEKNEHANPFTSSEDLVRSRPVFNWVEQKETVPVPSTTPPTWRVARDPNLAAPSGWGSVQTNAPWNVPTQGDLLSVIPPLPDLSTQVGPVAAAYAAACLATGWGETPIQPGSSTSVSATPTWGSVRESTQ